MVRCADCGFLCVRSNTGELAEVPDFVRRSWIVENDFWRTHHTAAVCFVRALPEEERQEALKRTKDSRKIIDKDRECSCFMEWRQGFTSKEHREMQLSEDLRKWQEEQKRRDQEREDRLEKERESRRQDERERERQWLEQQQAKDQEREEENRRWQVKWQIINTCLGAILGFAIAAMVYWLGWK